MKTRMDTELDSSKYFIGIKFGFPLKVMIGSREEWRGGIP